MKKRYAMSERLSSTHGPNLEDELYFQEHWDFEGAGGGGGGHSLDDQYLQGVYKAVREAILDAPADVSLCFEDFLIPEAHRPAERPPAERPPAEGRPAEGTGGSKEQT